jgi:hypothetical protein
MFGYALIGDEKVDKAVKKLDEITVKESLMIPVVILDNVYETKAEAVEIRSEVRGLRAERQADACKLAPDKTVARSRHTLLLTAVVVKINEKLKPVTASFTQFDRIK